MALSRALAAELLGTAFLLATVVGSGVLAEKLAQGNVALCVLIVAIATGGVLYSLIKGFGSVSAHFNPLVTLVSCLRKEQSWAELLPFWTAQILGACCGVMAANLMFDLPIYAVSTTVRGDLAHPGQWMGEVVATFGLIFTIISVGKSDSKNVPVAVSTFVAGAICFTSSTCFANPAVTISRMLTNTLTGIAPHCVPAYLFFQIIGALAAVAFSSWFLNGKVNSAPCGSDDAVARLEELVKR